MHQKGRFHADDAFNLGCGIIKDRDELGSDDFAFFLRIFDPGEFRQEALFRIDPHHGQVKAFSEKLHHPVALLIPEKSGVDKHAVKTVPDRTVNQDCRHSGVHST